MSLGRLGARGGFGSLGFVAGGVPLWVPPGAIIDEIFTTGQYYPRPIASELADVRASAAYAADASGVWSSFLSNVTRITNAGMTNEPARTNSILQSQAFDNAAWTKTDTTVTPNATSPDGTLTADLLTEGSAGTASTAQIGTVTSASLPMSAQIFLKALANNTWIKVSFVDGASLTGIDAWMNLLTGAVGTVQARGTATAVSAQSEAAANGFWRIKLLATFQAGVSNAQLFIRSSSADAAATRVNNAAYYAWQADIQTGASVASPILTTTAAVTRAADAITIQRTGIGRVVFTFDDNSQQTVSGISTAAQYTLPTNLNRAIIKRMTGYAA